jgi:hypothetical protein
MVPIKNIGAYLPMLILAVICYAAYRALNGSGLFNQVFGETEEQKNTQKTDDIIKSIPVDISKATITNAQASIFAERLQKAMNPISGFSADYDGSDETAIFSVFAQMNNKQDAKMIYKAFGLRAYTSNWILDNDRIDLIAWLHKELSPSDIAKISTKLNWMVYG